MIHTEGEEEEVCTGLYVFIVTGDRAVMQLTKRSDRMLFLTQCDVLS